MWSTTEVRQKFLAFWQAQGHQVVPSSSLVPGNDPTLLFTNAGMVQFKELFLGLERRGYTRAVTSQRCVRAGGKHNDLENVGYTARHHTFFEMLGNFSFGDYFKREAINNAWTLLTEVFLLPKEKLLVTVYFEDDEAYRIWADEIGVPEDKIIRINDKAGQRYQSDNFWAMGDTGPCGPCSEIFYDHGPEVWGGPPGSAEEDGDRFIEIWNLVFMQFERSADGSMKPLPAPCVDTGMGLERVSAVLQNVHSNYQIDLFEHLIAAAASLTECTDLDNASLKVISDHIRSAAFLIIDGVTPDREGRGYVLRRIIRRALRHGYKLGCKKAFFHAMVAPLVAQMADAYPELKNRQERIEQVLLREEERFLTTLESGMRILDEAIETLPTTQIPGQLLFTLYDRYGFPVDLVADIARELALSVDMPGFEACMQAQREGSRVAGQFGVDHSQHIRGTKTTFLGYETLQAKAQITALHNEEGAQIDALDCGMRGVLVLDKTPFYAESGGQIGDRGYIRGADFEFVVEDTRKSGATYTHWGHVGAGRIVAASDCDAEVTSQRRSLTLCNHSATHLLHSALRHVLGTHVEQRGSLVTPEHLRFDFSHDAPLSAEEKTQVEAFVNAEIRRNSAAQIREMPIDEAKAEGAAALFGEKYGDIVRVVRLGPTSIELCGGTHVQRTGDIGVFRINNESGVAAGVRRIEAVTAEAALADIAANDKTINQLSSQLKVAGAGMSDKVAQLLVRVRSLERELEDLKIASAAKKSDDLLADSEEIDGVRVFAQTVVGVDAKGLRALADRFRDQLKNTVFVLATIEAGKVRLLAAVSGSASGRVKAGELVNFVAAQVGGKGGGRPDLAQAGGDHPEALPEALAGVAAYVREKLT